MGDPVTASLVVGALGTGYSIYQGQEAAAAQRKASNVERRKLDLQAARERTRVIREARIKRAQIESQAAATGVAGSTGQIGGVAGVQSQAAGGIGFLNQMQSLSTQSAAFQNKALEAQARGQIGSAIGGIGMTIFDQQGGFKTMAGQTTRAGKDVFSPAKSATIFDTNKFIPRLDI